MEMDDSGNQALRDLGIFYCAAYVVSPGRLLPGLVAVLGCLAAGQPVAGPGYHHHGVGGCSAAGDNNQGGCVVYGIGRDENQAMREEGRTEGIEQGRTEGIEQGRAEGIEQERKRRRKREEEARAKFGVEVAGVLMLPQTPEVERFLDGEATE